jgi:hypothetical protein
MIVGKRSLELRQQQGSISIEVRIFQPQARQGHWCCDYEIDWPEGTHKFSAGGADSMQALIIALNMIGAEIYTSNYHKSGDLRSSDSWKGYGFPVPKNIRDLLEGDDATYF